jgi:hypothetical protein
VNDHQNDDLSKRRGCVRQLLRIHAARPEGRHYLKDKRAGEGRFVRRSRDTSRQPERQGRSGEHFRVSKILGTAVLHAVLPGGVRP